MTPQELLASWHAQQTAFIEQRELRTNVMVEVLRSLSAELDKDLRVLDVAGGPGTLGHAVLEALPNAQVVSIDRDPILLRLGKETNQYGERLQFVDGDLTSPEWMELVGADKFDAAISATALHWFTPDQLVTLYQQLGDLLHPNAVFMNADHLYFDTAHNPFMRSVSERVRDEFFDSFTQSEAMGWEEWWDTVLALPGWEAEAKLWRERWAHKTAIVKVSAEFHLAALRAAGFSQTDQIYQWFDDRVIYGRLPADWAGIEPLKH